MSHAKKILMLVTHQASPGDKNWNFFQAAVQKSIGDTAEIVMGGLLYLTYELTENDSKVYDRTRGYSLDEFDLVVFRITRQEFGRASSCASFLQAKGIPYIDSQVQPAPWSKYAAQAMRQAAGLCSIPSVFSSNDELIYMIQEDKLPFGYPIIIKDNNGKKGRLNFIARTKEDALQILRDNPDTPFIIQAFIENDGDYRFLVMGDQVVLAIHRLAQTGSHLNNTSQGAVASIVDLSSFDPAVLEDVKRSAALEKLQVAGVDIMFDKHTGQHYVIEVNSSPQLATGADPERKLKAYTDYLSSLL